MSGVFLPFGSGPHCEGPAGLLNHVFRASDDDLRGGGRIAGFVFPLGLSIDPPPSMVELIPCKADHEFSQSPDTSGVTDCWMLEPPELISHERDSGDPALVRSGVAKGDTPGGFERGSSFLLDRDSSLADTRGRRLRGQVSGGAVVDAAEEVRLSIAAAAAVATTLHLAPTHLKHVCNLPKLWMES